MVDERFGGDDHQRDLAQPYLTAVRDAVLAAAAVGEGDALADVGAGDGLVGLAAIGRVGDSGSVTFVDISDDLLDRCRAGAEQLGGLGRCRFVRASAEELDGVATASVDAVTTRAVLIYVADKRAALETFSRVLRPGGRVAIYEPINAYGHPEPPGRFLGYDIAGLGSVGARLRAAYDRISADRCSSMLDFDERTLIDLAEVVGFTDLRLTLTVEVQDRPVIEAPSWEAFLASSPNPLMPTVRDLISDVLSSAEERQVEDHLAPLVVARAGCRRNAEALLRGIRP